MKKYNSRKPLYSIHNFKTAGSSFSYILYEWFGKGFIHHKYIPKEKGIDIAKPERSNAIGIPIPVCVHGHFPNNVDLGLSKIYPDFTQCIIFLRNPLELQISAYHFALKLFENDELYHERKKVNEFPYNDLNHFLENKSSLLNDMPWQLTQENYKERFEEYFVYVGITEYFKQSVYQLSDILKKPKPREIPKENVTYRRFQASPSSIKKFEENNALEYEIYDYILSQNNYR